MLIAGKDANDPPAQFDRQFAEFRDIANLHLPMRDLGVFGIGREVGVGRQTFKIHPTLPQLGLQTIAGSSVSISRSEAWGRFAASITPWKPSAAAQRSTVSSTDNRACPQEPE